MRASSRYETVRVPVVRYDRDESEIPSHRERENRRKQRGREPPAPQPAQ